MMVYGVNTFAQGGPPMITDDPFTPDSGHWENNIALQWTHTADTHLIEFPAADINYGWNERTQLKIEMPLFAYTSEAAHSVIGRGDVRIGIKERFIDEEQSGFALSTYPQYQFATATATDEIDGAQFFLPIEAAKTFGRIHLAAEAGYNFVNSSTDEISYGVVGGYDVNKQWEWFAELHRENEIHGEAEESILNVGMHYDIGHSLALLASAGTTLNTEKRGHTSLAYLGFQILL
jgi:hypothetical protein